MADKLETGQAVTEAAEEVQEAEEVRNTDTVNPEETPEKPDGGNPDTPENSEENSETSKSAKPKRTNLEELETAAEAILFASGEPVKLDRICLALELEPAMAERVLHRLKDYYAFERRGIRLLQMEDAWQLCSAPDYADTVRRAFEIRKPAKLSQPALEVLTIFAYYQPTTRAYVDKLRGVDSSYTVSLLLERKLIEPCGRLQAPGRPQVYRTTKNFLRAFHLTSLDDLPPLPEGGERLRPEEQAAILAAEGADATLLTTQPPDDADSTPPAGSGASMPPSGSGEVSADGAALPKEGGNGASSTESAGSTVETLDSEMVADAGDLPEGAIGMEGADDDSAVDTGDFGAPASPAVPDAGAGAGLHAGQPPVPGFNDWIDTGAFIPAAGEETREAGEEKA